MEQRRRPGGGRDHGGGRERGTGSSERGRRDFGDQAREQLDLHGRRMDEGDEGPEDRGNLGRGSDSPTGGVDLEPFLEAGGFPVTKSELLARAERAGAPAHVRALLERLPEREYMDVLDISREIGGLGSV